MQQKAYIYNLKMFKFVSSIGNAAYKTAAKTGLAAGTEMPPYPCALPLQVIDDSEDTYQIEAILDATFDAILDLSVGNMAKLNASITDESRRKGWKELDFVDSEGDLVLHSRPHVGPYNFALATLTLDNVPASLILKEMHAQNLQARKRYSSSISEYSVVHRNPAMPAAFVGHDNDHLEELAERGIRDWHIEYTCFYAPPPVASRDFFILIEKRYVPETGKYYIYGTSVDFPEADQKRSGFVRGIVMFGWEFIHTDDGMTHCTYISCMNPNGWAPTFLVSWMKTEVAKEIQHSRRILYEITGRSIRTAAQNVAAAAAAASSGGNGSSVRPSKSKNRASGNGSSMKTHRHTAIDGAAGCEPGAGKQRSNKKGSSEDVGVEKTNHHHHEDENRDGKTTPPNSHSHSRRHHRNTHHHPSNRRNNALSDNGSRSPLKKETAMMQEDARMCLEDERMDLEEEIPI